MSKRKKSTNKRQRHTQAGEYQTAPSQPAGTVIPQQQSNRNAHKGEDNKRMADSLSNRIIAGGTILLGVIGIGSLLLTYGALMNNGRQLDILRKDERAWLTPSQVGQLTFAPNQPLTTTLMLTNTGKTPAKKVAAQFFIEFVKNGEEPDYNKDTPHTLWTSAILLPNAPQSIVVYRQKFTNANRQDYTADLVTPDEQAAAAKGELWSAVYGKITYSDIFGAQHWITLCLWGGVPGAYSSRGCSNYNDTDDQ